ncbi:FMN-linked oxidoreductase [Mycena sp. CBHHK59/15]|nr:FMN-linked oxidoreductase [Mycena sp. CBHHK59/15]
MNTPKPKLFQPIKLGDILLKHRIVMAPLTRIRADVNHVPLPHVQEYYVQRASVPGTLLISEATCIAPRAGGSAHIPGIWSEEQIAAWKQIADAVHAQGSFMFLQLWALGRAARPSDLKLEDPSFSYISASDIPLRERQSTDIRPRPLTVPEIKGYVELYRIAASNAIHKAGLDGVEIHNANGYLLDQFLQDVSNVRTDDYGGSPENRARFSLEVVDAVVAAVGPKKTGIRISPWNTYQNMGMEDPRPTFAHFVYEIVARHPELAYIHAIEPRVDATVLRPAIPEGWSNDFLRDIWASPASQRRFISAGDFSEAKDDIIAFGRQFVSNPDLPDRLLYDIPLAAYDRKFFYAPGSSDPKGYTDYPFAEQDVKFRPLDSHF